MLLLGDCVWTIASEIVGSPRSTMIAQSTGARNARHSPCWFVPVARPVASGRSSCTQFPSVTTQRDAEVPPVAGMLAAFPDFSKRTNFVDAPYRRDKHAMRCLSAGRPVPLSCPTETEVEWPRNEEQQVFSERSRLMAKYYVESGTVQIVTDAEDPRGAAL